VFFEHPATYAALGGGYPVDSRFIESFHSAKRVDLFSAVLWERASLLPDAVISARLPAVSDLAGMSGPAPGFCLA
ncbi:hypothetical protein, partial [Alistipes finegoldii]|uniref:hypothetical protein n=1 Tax=Alistipes finegoldii TaxID=214856 RepID=UPI001D0896DB